MKCRSCRSWVCPFARFLFLVLWTGEAFAAFHLMRIDEVMAGAGGNPEIQFVELQMTTAFQTFVSGHAIQFFDASGNLTESFTIPGNVQNGPSGSSILIGTEAFRAVSTVAPDFIMPPGILAPGGRVCFAGSDVDPCVSYGNYTGSMTVRGINYGAPASALPIVGVQSLKRVRTAFPFNNSTDFVLGPPAPRNNAGQSGVVELPDPSGNRFQRANCNGDALTDISDAVSLLSFLFSGAEPPPCAAACNANSDAVTDISDAVFILLFLFTGGSPPASPFPACEQVPATECAQETCSQT